MEVILRTPTYQSYQNARSRCYNPKSNRYEQYGGRGIVMCDRWLGEDGYANFLADMGERPSGKTLDRKDVNGPYSPDNCRWATPLEQGSGRQNNILVEHEGSRISLRHFAKTQGVGYHPLYRRVKAGESPHEAAETLRRQRWVQHDGKRMKVAEFARAVGVNYKALHSRMTRDGIGPHEAAARITRV